MRSEPSLRETIDDRDGIDVAEESSMMRLLAELFPKMRTSVGPSLRKSLIRLQQEIDLEILEVVSGTQVGDWTVPQEWDLRTAYVEDSQGQRWIDSEVHSLHVINGASPVDRWLEWEELDRALWVDPRDPSAIPYRTCYYESRWGFCLSQKQKEELRTRSVGPWRVVIDSIRLPGSLSIGELFLPGSSHEEVIFSAHLCHPSLANDNLSGVVVAVALARWLASQPRRYSYRFLFGPGTLGPMAWWHQHTSKESVWLGGAVLTMLGDGSPLNFKLSLHGESLFDQVVCDLASESVDTCKIRSFEPEGYDERQFNALKPQVPLGRLSRADWRDWPAYHSSLDSLELIKPEQLGRALRFLKQVCLRLEETDRPAIAWGGGEPQLGRHGLWASPLSNVADQQWREAVSWLSCLADGTRTASTIARQSSLPISLITQTVRVLSAHGLLLTESGESTLKKRWEIDGA